VLVVVCARLSALYATDAGLGRLSVVGGASIYPAVQSFCLACRALGLGTTLTTLLCRREDEVRGLLGIPDGVATAAHVAAGHPARPWPERLTRRPLAQTAFADRYGEALTRESFEAR
jgi:nitroreductase